jgi:aminotransferase
MISVFGSQIGAEELAEVTASLGAQWMGMGPKVKAFEKEFAAHLGAADFAMLDSGSNSLYTAITLLDLPGGSEVILPSFTWIACAHAVVLAGLKPIFCDVDVATMNVTAPLIAAKVSPRTSAVMVVHYAGLPVEMQPVLDLGLPVIEDAAHAACSVHRGRACGTIGDVGIYSFDAVKNLASPDGGGVVARDIKRVERARVLRYCGIGKSGFESSATKDRWWEYDVRAFFPRFLPNDISAAIALAQLRKLDALQERRRVIWNRYQEAFGDLAWLHRPVECPDGDRHSYFTYCVRIDGKSRDRLAKYLYDRGIYSTLRYHPLHMNPIYGATERLPTTERLNEQALSLPLHPRLSDGDVDQVIDGVRSFDA